MLLMILFHSNEISQSPEESAKREAFTPSEMTGSNGGGILKQQPRKLNVERAVV